MQGIARGQDKHRHAAAGHVGAAQAPGQLQPIHARQANVDDGRIERFVAQHILGPLAAAHPVHGITRVGEPQLMPLATITSSSTRSRRMVRPRSVRPDHGAVGLLGQNFEQHGVHAAINDVHGVHAGLGGVQRAAILGNMPPEMVPSANSSSMRRAVRSVSRLPALSSTPGVFVSSISFSALSTSARLLATTSALML